MKLVVLGSSGYHPNEVRQTTCLVIPELGLVFDAGTAFFRLPDFLQTGSLDIFLTHAHLDHVVGLTYLLSVQYRYKLDEVRVHGDAAKLKAIREHLFAEELFPVEPSYTEVPLVEGSAIEVGTNSDKAKITWTKLVHPGSSVGYRVDLEDKSLAFITDTTAQPDADYIEFIRGVDLLVHECNFSDGFEELAKETGHSCVSPVAEVAKQAEVGGLVLIHFDPLRVNLDADAEAIKNAESIFSPIVHAEDCMEIEF